MPEAEQTSIDQQAPDLKLGIMHGLKSKKLLDVWSSVLEAQTRILGPSEIEWLRTKDALNGDMLEIGSGTGAFGSFLAKNYPQGKLHGLEANPQLIRYFYDRDQRERPGNYHISKCSVGSDPFPKQLRGRCNTSILRFVLQHTSSPVRVLEELHEIMPTKGRLYIIEEDDRLFTSHIGWPPFDRVVDIWRRVCQAGGTNSRIGLELPHIVETAGYQIEDYRIVLRNSVEMGDAFGELLSGIGFMMCQTNPTLIMEGELEQVIDGFAESYSQSTSRFVGTYPQILLVASKKSWLFPLVREMVYRR